MLSDVIMSLMINPYFLISGAHLKEDASSLKGNFFHLYIKNGVPK